MKQGLGSALEAAFTANSADLLRYLSARTEVSEDAADALGDAMVAAWRNIRKLPSEPTQARMWLFVLARNALSNVNRAKRRRTIGESKLAEALTIAARGYADHVDDVLMMRTALQSMPPHLAELLRLVHWDGFTLHEAAELLDTSPSTIRSQHVRAKELLRAAVARNVRS